MSTIFDRWKLTAILQLVGLAYTCLTTVNVSLGYGKHSAVIADRLETVLLINYVGFLLGILAFSLPKLAVAALLTRLLNPTLVHRIILWGLTATVAVVSCICILVLFTMCDPPRALWQTSLMAQGATCRDTWILINYAIFTGGGDFLDLVDAFCFFGAKLTFYSCVCVCRSCSRRVPNPGSNEAPYVLAEKIGLVHCFKPGRSVSVVCEVPLNYSKTDHFSCPALVQWLLSNAFSFQILRTSLILPVSRARFKHE